jgi:hypothetical protein
MKKNIWIIVLIVANLAAIIWVVIRFLNLSYPIVGHDYSLTIPTMLDAYLHYHLNGISIEWYTPTIGGGVPVFPDPNNGQFSILALLQLLVNPWLAVIVSSAIYIILGGIASYYLFRHVLKLHWTSSILGMVFFSANGFEIERIAVGHLGYHIYPLIAILLVALMDTSMRDWVAGLLFSVVMAMLVYGSGYFIIVVFGFVSLIAFPLVYLYNPALISWKRTGLVLAWAAVGTLLLTASKLAAVYAFIRFFPREIADNYKIIGPVQGLFGIVLQLMGTMNTTPLFWLMGVDTKYLTAYIVAASGAEYGLWELDMSLSPVLFGIIVIGFYSFLRRTRKPILALTKDKKWIAFIFLIFSIWLTIEFILAKGLIYPWLRRLPILGSLHVNPRFTLAFLFPLAILAAIIYNRWISGWSSRKSIPVFIGINLLTLLPLLTYLTLPGRLQQRNYDITDSYKIYNDMQAGDDFTITAIESQLTNTQALERRVSNLAPYDPIFGYSLENFRPEIKPGSIWEITDGYYNMTNPSGYVFPEVNHTRLFERIPVSQKGQLEAFAAHRQPDWKIPLYQQILDWVSGISFCSVILILILYGISRAFGKGTDSHLFLPFIKNEKTD